MARAPWPCDTETADPADDLAEIRKLLTRSVQLQQNSLLLFVLLFVVIVVLFFGP